MAMIRKGSPVEINRELRRLEDAIERRTIPLAAGDAVEDNHLVTKQQLDAVAAVASSTDTTIWRYFLYG